MSAPEGEISRRSVLLLLGTIAAGCASRPSIEAPPSPARSPPNLKLDPAVDLVASAGLLWLVEGHPDALLANPTTGPAIAVLVPDRRLQVFADRHGGVDLRRTEQLAVAGYGRTTLALASTAFDPARVEAAFVQRASVVKGRATERGVTLVSGSVGEGRERVALFGDHLVGMEWGEPGPLQAAEYFAQGRLRRSLPALRSVPLAAAAALLGQAPLRVFGSGPFEGAWTRAGAGLLGGATAVGAAMRPSAGAGAAVDVRVVLTGGWGDDAKAAAERLRSAFGVLAADPLGQLTGIDRPIAGPHVGGAAEALQLDVTLDALWLARGLRSATGADLDEIMSY